MTKKLSPKTMSHTFNGTSNLGSVLVNGAFDVNVWYSYENDTKTAVSTRRFNYTEKIYILQENLSPILTIF